MSPLLDLPYAGADPLTPFPPAEQALETPNGLLAWGGDLQPERLLQAYRQGIFPWYSQGQPILWWNPAPRCVLLPSRVYASKRTRRRYNGGIYKLSIDRAFDEVIEACAQPREYESSTWITREMIDAYSLLHRMGHAHSLEVWRDGSLAGGIYGLHLGGMFFGESMFSRQTDASKIALIGLCRILEAHGFDLLDCQVGNPHLITMGAEDISRPEFESTLKVSVARTDISGTWAHTPKFESRW
jgi:leucyl/phenylalanyl-tRNA--protein transferase